VKNKITAPAVLVFVFASVFAVSRRPGLMPQNFSAAYALFFCAGLYLPRKTAWILPLAISALTDILLTFCYYKPAGYSLRQFAADMAPNYAAYAALIALGRALGAKRRWGTLVGGGIFGALLFYFITNTAAWLALPYAKTLAGWIQSWTKGLPGYPPAWEFFRGAILSGAIFSALFTGAMKLLEAADTAPEPEAPLQETEPEDAEPVLAPATHEGNDR
jgi:hypothetical protein